MKSYKLFDDAEYCIAPDNLLTKKVTHNYCNSLQKRVTVLCQSVTLTSNFQQPIIHAYTGAPPILRYGAKQQGEYERISRYYPNDNLLIAEERRNGYGR